MRIKVAICENNKLDIQKIKQCLESYEILSNIDFQIHVFTDAKALLKAYNQSGLFQILFIEAQLPDQSGLDVAHYIRHTLLDSMVKIVFVSDSTDHMQKSFDVQAYHYFLKPLEKKDLINLIDHIMQDYKKNTSTLILLKEDNAEELIYLKDILYILTKDANNRRLLVHLAERTILSIGRITDYAEQLKEFGFVSTTKGCLVNIRHIKYLQEKSVIMDNDDSVSLSRRKSKQLHDMFKNQVVHVREE